MELNIEELVEFVYEKIGGTVDKETLFSIFELETDFMIEKGIIVVEDEEFGDSLG